MDLLGISSSYITSIYSASKTSPVSVDKEEQKNFDTKISSGSSSDIDDTATISDEALKRYSAEKSINKSDESSDFAGSKNQKGSSNSFTNTKQLTTEQQRQVTELKSEDTRVKTHEQAHIAASFGLDASAPSYTYETGPDGKKYAVSGEVNVSFSQSEDPEINLEKAQAMKRAALAPADPSTQDRSVAAKADRLIAQAKAEIAKENEQKTSS